MVYEKNTLKISSDQSAKFRASRLWLPLFMGIASCIAPSFVHAAAEANPIIATGANPALWNVTWNKTYYVSPTGNDTNTGTSRANALLTIQEAVDRGRIDHNNGNHVHILVAPGTYRESVSVNYPALTTPKSLLLERDGTTGTVTITGASSIPPGSWTAGTTAGQYSIAWTKNWGFATPNWPSQTVLVNSVLARREGVFLNNAPMQQVLQKTALFGTGNGSFWVDETNNKLWISVQGGLQSTDNIQVITQDNPCTITNSDRVQFRNIKITRFSTVWTRGSLSISNSNNIYLDTCVFSQGTAAGCNYDGTGGNLCTNLTFDNCQFNSNGSLGLGGNDAQNVLLTGISAALNNYRGAWMNYSRWYIAGAKLSATDRLTVKNSNFTDNETHGLWFDVGDTNMSVTNCNMIRNYAAGDDSGDGIFIEISFGPCEVSACTMTGSKYGAYVSNSANVSINNCHLVDNITSGLGVRNIDRGAGTPPFCNNFWFHNNEVRNTSPTTAGKAMIKLDAPGTSSAEITLSDTKTQQAWSNANFYGNNYHTSDTTSFQRLNGSTGFVNFAAWKSATGLDTTGSTYSTQ